MSSYEYSVTSESTESELREVPSHSDSHPAEQKSYPEPSHADIMLSSIRELREQDIVRDFTIVVEGENFVVHRTVLAACSPYFRAMLSHDTIERSSSVVEMKDVRADAVKKCIDFMYTGITGQVIQGLASDIAVDRLRDVIHATNLMQLDKLFESCFDQIGSRLTPENCLGISNFLEIYRCDRLKNKLDKFIRMYFERIICTEAFLSLSQTDLKEILKKCERGNEAIWKAIKNWIGHDEDRQSSIDELLQLLSLDEFPTYIMLQEVCKEPLIMTSLPRVDLFHRLVFTSTSNLTKILTVENCIIVRNWGNTYKHLTKEADDVINKFLLDNFDKFLAKKEFVEVDIKDVLMLFEAKNVDNLASEKLKWISAVRWVKHDLTNRRGFFPNLIKNINFKEFNDDFMQSDVREEPLIKDCDECSKILMDSVFGKKLKEKTNKIAILSSSKKFRSYDLQSHQWTDVSCIEGEKLLKIFSLNNKLCAVTLAGIYYLRENKIWKQIAKPLSAISRLIAFDDRIYFIGEGSFFCYNILRNEWTNLRRNDVLYNTCCVARLDNYIYVFSKNKSCMYNIESNQWNDIGKLPFEPISATECLGKIYILGANEFTIYAPSDDERKICLLIDPIMHQTNWNCKEISAFTVENKLVAATMSDEKTIYLRAYDTITTKWTNVSEGNTASSSLGTNAIALSSSKWATILEKKISQKTPTDLQAGQQQKIKVSKSIEPTKRSVTSANSVNPDRGLSKNINPFSFSTGGFYGRAHTSALVFSACCFSNLGNK